MPQKKFDIRQLGATPANPQFDIRKLGATPAQADTLLESRRAASKSEFEANLPENQPGYVNGVLRRMDAMGDRAKAGLQGAAEFVYGLDANPVATLAQIPGGIVNGLRQAPSDFV